MPAVSVRPLFLLLVGVLLAAGATGCGREGDRRPATAGGVLPAVQGVRSSLTEVARGRYVISGEQLVDSATVVLITHRDGEVERIETAEAFAARLDVPDSLRARVAAHTGPVEALPPDAPGPAWNVPEEGLPLGTALFYTMAMNVWRPAAYAAILAPRDEPGPVLTPAAGAAAPQVTPRAATPTRRAVAPAPTRRSVAPSHHERKGKGKGKGKKRKGW